MNKSWYDDAYWFFGVELKDVSATVALVGRWRCGLEVCCLIVGWEEWSIVTVIWQIES